MKSTATNGETLEGMGKVPREGTQIVFTLPRYS